MRKEEEPKKEKKDVLIETTKSEPNPIKKKKEKRKRKREKKIEKKYVFFLIQSQTGMCSSPAAQDGVAAERILITKEEKGRVRKTKHDHLFTTNEKKSRKMTAKQIKKKDCMYVS